MTNDGEVQGLPKKRVGTYLIYQRGRLCKGFMNLKWI